jgi:hypothetical protein
MRVIHLAHNKIPLGTMDEERLREAIRRGHVQGGVLCWWEGMSKWSKISIEYPNEVADYHGRSASAPPPPPPMPYATNAGGSHRNPENSDHGASILDQQSIEDVSGTNRQLNYWTFGTLIVSEIVYIIGEMENAADAYSDEFNSFYAISLMASIAGLALLGTLTYRVMASIPARLRRMHPALAIGIFLVPVVSIAGCFAFSFGIRASLDKWRGSHSKSSEYLMSLAIGLSVFNVICHAILLEESASIVSFVISMTFGIMILLFFNHVIGEIEKLKRQRK